MNDWCKWHEHAPCILLWCPSSQLSIKICILQGKISHYCLNRGNGNGTTPNSCAEATQADIDLLTSSMAACFKTAVAAGVNIAISPHLDDGLGLGELSAPEATAEICENGQWQCVQGTQCMLYYEAISRCLMTAFIFGWLAHAAFMWALVVSRMRLFVLSFESPSVSFTCILWDCLLSLCCRKH